MGATLLKLLELSIAPIASYFSARLGLKYGLKHLQKQKEFDFIERQLREFYSPLVGCRNIIKTKNEFRAEINRKSNEAWQEKCRQERLRVSDPFDINLDKHRKHFDEIANYDNEQFINEIMPCFRKMLSIFTENIWLAEPETLKWYPDFCKFLEQWERFLTDKIHPPEVLEKLDLKPEEKLQPFYADLENQMERLRNKLKGKNQA